MKVPETPALPRQPVPEDHEASDTEPLLFNRAPEPGSARSLLGDLSAKIKDIFAGQSAAETNVRAARNGPHSASVHSPSDLIGKTLKPEAASQIGDYVELNHLGKVTGLKLRGHLLTRADVSELADAVIPELAHSNSSAPRDMPRTNREVILELICALRSVLECTAPDDGEKYTLLSKISASLQRHWLSSEVGTQKSVDMLTTAESLLRDSGHFPELANKASELAAEARAKKHYIQKQDNAFGRKFESELAHELIKTPPSSVISAAAKTGEFLKNLFLVRLSASPDGDHLSALAEAMSKDARPWQAETPEIGQFIEAPSKANFELMMAVKGSSGYEVIKQSYLGAKISLALGEIWMMEANFNYSNVIRPSRSSTPSVLGEFIRRSPKIIDDLNKLLQEDKQAFKHHKSQTAVFLKFLDAQSQLTTLKEPVTAGMLASTLESIAAQLPDCPSKVYALSMSAELRTQDNDSLTELTSGVLSKRELSQLNNDDIEAQQATTRSYGTSLPHHPPSSVPANWQAGRSVQASVNLNLESPTPFEKNMLANDQNVVVGLSGTTNIMTALYLHMLNQLPEAQKADFRLTDALAGTLMFVVFDGGHSIPEVIGAYQSMKASASIRTDPSLSPLDQPRLAKKTSQDIVDHFVLDYADLPQLFESADTRSAVSDAIQRAFDQTCELFSTVHAQRVGSGNSAPSRDSL